MIDTRTLVFSVLTLTSAASVVLGLRGGAPLPPGLGRADAANSAEFGAQAWALLAEAEELCRPNRGPAVPVSRESSSTRGTSGLPEANSEDRAASARRAVAGEALEIVRELTAGSPAAGSSALILRTERRLRIRCAGNARAARQPEGFRGSLDGSSPSARAALLIPFLDRLNDAASRGAANSLERAESLGADPQVPKPSPKEEPTVVASSADPEQDPTGPPGHRSDPSVREGRVGGSAIRIGGASSDYRERLRRWSLVFEREARALRVSRSRLQVEIDGRSMAEARDACRSFGMALARLDDQLVSAAPSRGLSLRIERMVERYWRGVAQCAAARPAAAFAYLSEGDREWATIAQMAARMFRPRPMKPLRAEGPGEATAHAPE